jgi:hypothetical protein
MALLDAFDEEVRGPRPPTEPTVQAGEDGSSSFGLQVHQ